MDCKKVTEMRQVLSANPKKTEFMFIGHPRRIEKIESLAPLKLSDTEIKSVRKTKSPGLLSTRISMGRSTSNP